MNGQRHDDGGRPPRHDEDHKHDHDDDDDRHDLGGDSPLPDAEETLPDRG